MQIMGDIYSSGMESGGEVPPERSRSPLLDFGHDADASVYAPEEG
jgi:hypothetical protein